MTTESNETQQTKQVRLHVGGLPAKINEKDIEDRFRSFGTVQKVDLIPHPFDEGACRGFAYVNLETSDAQLSKCMNVLNGCAWKGGKLHISFAKANKFRTLDDGRIVFTKNEEEEKKKKIPKKKRKLVRHSGDFSLVTDKNVDKRKGWRRGRYGRAIACLRIRRPNRQMLVIDPSHYKNNLEKLFGSVKPKPLSQLSWTITDIEIEKDEVDYEAEEELEEVMELDNVEDAADKNNNMDVDEVEEGLEVEIEAEAESDQEAFDVIESENVTPSEIQEENNVDMDAYPMVEDPIIVNTIESKIATEEPKTQNSSAPPVAAAIKPEAKFEVNVNWSSLFAPATEESTSLFGNKVSNNSSSGGFSLNSLIEKSTKIKNVSVDELFKKPEVPVVAALVKHEESQVQTESSAAADPVKKVHNYAHLFGDLNRITPTTAVRFGMHLSRKEDLLQEWRIERIELKEDFKKRLAEGKRRNRRGNNNKTNI